MTTFPVQETTSVSDTQQASTVLSAASQPRYTWACLSFTSYEHGSSAKKSRKSEEQHANICSQTVCMTSIQEMHAAV